MPESDARQPPVAEGVTLYEHQRAAYERALIVFGYPPVEDAQGSEVGKEPQSEGGDALCSTKAPVTAFCLSQPRHGAGLTGQVINGNRNCRTDVS